MNSVASRMPPVVRPPATAAEWEEYHRLCWEVLRRPWGQPPGSERDPAETAAFHLLAEQGGGIVGAGRIHHVADRCWQVRYMAVRPGHERRGIGTAVLAGLLEHASRHGGGGVFLNARDGTIGFYRRAGFTVVGDGPVLYGEIRHTRMEREIDGSD